jgi:hypothetical protein
MVFNKCTNTRLKIASSRSSHRNTDLRRPALNLWFAPPLKFVGTDISAIAGLHVIHAYVGHGSLRVYSRRTAGSSRICASKLVVHWQFVVRGLFSRSRKEKRVVLGVLNIDHA